ncbi:MAG: V-type ATP synthase subunit F [Treponema sp.]|nr:V-type ATP synthase subunit F [Treponema sp.]
MDYFFLGDEELVTAFRFVGINGIAVRNSGEAIAAFRKITEGSESGNADLPAFIPSASECQVLLLTEETSDWLGSMVIDWQLSGHYPLLVEIPGISGRLEGRKTLVEAIREAIGLHV